ELLNLTNKPKYIEITASEIVTMEFDELYLFANWCPHCMVFLKNYVEDRSYKMLFVSSNYDLPYNSKHFGNLDTIYVLSNAQYGSVESEKILVFTAELLDQDSALINGVPQQFTREDGRIVRFQTKRE
ncbi:MAG: hypothetical protein RBR28_11445, partial [Lentimicrobium sp.]|nr:hypothetical protein [Lentimicrobium sp.]